MANGLYEDILEFFISLGLRFVRKFMPYFLCSFGAHIIHISNLQTYEDGTPAHFFLEHGHPPDLRLHILFIAPSGFSKSTFLNHSLDEDYNGVFCGIVETFFKGLVTAAHLSGSAGIKKSGETYKIEGFLEKHPEAIVGVEEISSILIAGKQEHSLEMENLLLDWLRGGKIRKGLRGTDDDKGYVTKATLWAGTQPGKERIELSGGMHRRFFFILWIPSTDDELILREAAFDGVNVPCDYTRLKNIRVRLGNLRERVDRLEGIYFTKDLQDYLMKFDHNYIELLKRLAIGYAVMQEDFDRDLNVGLDDELKRLIDESVAWRQRVFRELSRETGLGTDLLMMVLKRNMNEDGWMTFNDLADKMMLLGGESYSDTHDYLKALKNCDPPRIKAWHDEKTGKVLVMPLE